jgi:4-hydroxy-2-oxoheptanedioate aldolase
MVSVSGSSSVQVSGNDTVLVLTPTLSCYADMLFVGPNDLCSSLGLPPLNHPNEPLVQAAIARVLKAAHEAGKYAGMFCVTPEQVLQRAEQGFDFMNLGADTVAVGAWNGQALKAIEKIR